MVMYRYLTEPLTGWPLLYMVNCWVHTQHRKRLSLRGNQPCVLYLVSLGQCLAGTSQCTVVQAAVEAVHNQAVGNHQPVTEPVVGSGSVSIVAWLVVVVP